MRRVDRLFQIIQLLRRNRVVTAQETSRKLGVSVRTVYRDLDHLSVSGVLFQMAPEMRVDVSNHEQLVSWIARLEKAGALRSVRSAR